ncbi:MAG TPA: hypothetical protein VGY77_08815 [Gemmataceae bacterium]|nr:hypothetical protein [Gemmataceae bacterium]
MKRYAWAKWGDINGFFGLTIDNVAVMMLLAGILTQAGFSRDFVLTRMIPGSALGVVIGDLVYTWMAFRLARRTNRTDVTAMPLGIDTPSTFAVAFLVLIPSFNEGLQRFSGDKQAAMEYAWHIGAVILILVGVFKTFFAPIGNLVRNLVPRAGLLGSLAAIAICLIAFLPLNDHLLNVPLVGLLSVMVILAMLIANRSLPGNIPGALAALGIGVGVYYVCLGLEPYLGPLVPHATAPEKLRETATLFPILHWDLVWAPALEKLPVILPFALATIVGGIDCTESAAAAGDEFDTRTVLLTEGLASLVAGLAGGVLQNTPYIGHPAYKAMGSRAAYTLATAFFVGAAGFLGWFPFMIDLLPHAAMFPILVFVGVEITAQSFIATPVKHYPALALAILPAVAALGNILIDRALGLGEPPLEAREMVQTLRCFSNGFIVTSLLWGAALAALMDGRIKVCASYFAVGGIFSLFGIIHSPFRNAVIEMPNKVHAQLQANYFGRVVPECLPVLSAAPQAGFPANIPWAALAHSSREKLPPPPAAYQTPYHWTAAYFLCAIFILTLGFFPPRQNTGHAE